MSSAICIIPARGGSRRIARKNIRAFHGRPILSYSIAVARASGLFRAVTVSTDDEEIAAVAVNHGATVHYRAPEFGADHVGTQAVTAEALRALEAEDELACCLYPCAPLTMAADLLQAKRHLEDNPRSTLFVFPVGTEPLRDAGAWYFGRTQAFLGEVALVSLYTRLLPLPARRVCDINTMADWRRAERLFADLWCLT